MMMCIEIIVEVRIVKRSKVLIECMQVIREIIGCHIQDLVTGAEVRLIGQKQRREVHFISIIL